MAKHLAIFIGNGAKKILKGEKTVEGRFSQSKIAPYLAVSKGDEIYLKEKGKILGKVIVDNVLYYENLDGETLGKLRKEYSDDLGFDDSFWGKKAFAKYATIIFLKNPRRFLGSIKLKKRDRRGWAVL